MDDRCRSHNDHGGPAADEPPVWQGSAGCPFYQYQESMLQMRTFSNPTIPVSIRTGLHAVRKAAARSPEAVYMFLLGLYMASILMRKIRWCKEVSPVKEAVRAGMIRIVLWGAVFYLLYTLYRINIRENKRVLTLSAAGIILITAAFLFSRHMTDNTYTFVMDAFFCFMAFGKDYRRLLLLYLGVRLGLIVTGVIGYAAGITVDFPVLKPGREDVLHSFGLSHPNTWGHIAFLLLLVIWYLYLSGRPVMTALLFWSVTVLILVGFSCKTVAVVLIPFPAAALLVDSVQYKSGIPFINTFINRRKGIPIKDGSTEIPIKNRRTQIPINSRTGSSAVEDRSGSPIKRERSEKGQEGSLRQTGGIQGMKKILKLLLVWLPLIAFAVSMLLCWQMDWVQKTFYETKFLSWAMRFVEGGYALRHNGITLFGHEHIIVTDPSVSYIGWITHQVDNAFAYQMIRRGILWVFAVTFWMVYVNYRCVKRRDYRFLLISGCMLFFAVMENFGLAVWYNFTLLYPFAIKTGRQVVSFGQMKPED